VKATKQKTEKTEHADAPVERLHSPLFNRSSSTATYVTSAFSVAVSTIYQHNISDNTTTSSS